MCGGKAIGVVPVVHSDDGVMVSSIFAKAKWISTFSLDHTRTAYLSSRHVIFAHQSFKHPLIKPRIHLTSLDSGTNIKPAAHFTLRQTVHVLRHVMDEVEARRKLEMMQQRSDERCD
jgi:DNA-directed RNA polymerase subunit L